MDKDRCLLAAGMIEEPVGDLVSQVKAKGVGQQSAPISPSCFGDTALKFRQHLTEGLDPACLPTTRRISE